MHKKLMTLALAASLLAGCASQTEEKIPTIGIAQLVDQTSLNTIREAMIDELDNLGYKDGETVNIDYQNAAGKADVLNTIMNKYDGEGADEIIAIATGTAQSAQNLSDHIPVIFSAVADPVGAGLVETLEEPGGNITGTSFVVQVDQILDLMKEMDPDIKTIGCLYTPGETNGVYTLHKFEDEAEKRGYTIVEATGTDLTTLQQAQAKLLEECDAIYSPNDNIVASGMTALAQQAVDAGIPYFVSADSMVADGGLATVGIDYEELGRETARMAVEVLEGKSPADIPVKVFQDDLSTYVNKDTLEKLGDKVKTPSSDKLVMLGTN